MAKKPFPSEEQDRYIVRFPDGMRDRLKEAAEANQRTMNSEIVARLQRTLVEDAGGGFMAPADEGDIKALFARAAQVREQLDLDDAAIDAAVNAIAGRLRDVVVQAAMRAREKALRDAPGDPVMPQRASGRGEVEIGGEVTEAEVLMAAEQPATYRASAPAASPRMRLNLRDTKARR